LSQDGLDQGACAEADRIGRGQAGLGLGGLHGRCRLGVVEAARV
jgi:hypothetical protein